MLDFPRRTDSCHACEIGHTSSELNSIDPTRTALVLGSSFLGVYAHAGFLNGLDASGLRPARVVGASAGALAGSLYAFGLRGDVLREAALDLKLRRSFVDAGVCLRLPGVISTLWSSGLFHGMKTVECLRSRFGAMDLTELELPLDLAVTDAETSRLEIRREGPLAELVMASCAVPVLFCLQTVGGRRYLDGGIAGELPFEHLLDDPRIDTVILHRIRHESGSVPGFFKSSVGNAIGVTRRTISHEVHRLRSELARIRGKRVIEMKTTTPFPGLFSHRRAPLCYERGLETGLRILESLKPSPP